MQGAFSQGGKRPACAFVCARRKKTDEAVETVSDEWLMRGRGEGGALWAGSVGFGGVGEGRGSPCRVRVEG